MRTPEAPLKLFRIYCYFLRAFSFFFSFKLQLVCEPMAALLFLEKVYVWKVLQGASGALYLSSAVRAHPHLAPSSSVNLSSLSYCCRSEMQIYDADVYVSSLQLFQASFFPPFQSGPSVSTKDKHRLPPRYSREQVIRELLSGPLRSWQDSFYQKYHDKHLILSGTTRIKSPWPEGQSPYLSLISLHAVKKTSSLIY